MSRYVIALGGNALGNNPEEQRKLIKIALKSIVPLIRNGDEIILSHGNGPQVGIINLAFLDSQDNPDIPYMPLPECTAMSQGYIGYHIQSELEKILDKEELDKDVATIITRVTVSPEDSAFKNLTKPVGPFYTKEEAEKYAKETGEVYVEDAGRGYRRVVASPKPQSIVEIETIKSLVKDGIIVIACGGGGIPVYKTNKARGASAVVDKDICSALLARDVEADKLIILTNVAQAEIDYNTPDAMKIGSISVEEAKAYIKEGEFASGSMLPKIEACIKFVNETGKEAIITSLNHLDKGLHGEGATIIHK